MAAKRRVSGKEIQDGIAALARSKGYVVAHFSPGRVGPRDSWITNYAYDSKGWPDLFLAKPGKVPIAIEVKGDGDSLSAEQDAWLMALRDSGITVAVITKMDWQNGVVERILDQNRSI